MEQKYVRVPFDLELAKKISDKSTKGNIVTRRGDEVRIVCWNYKSMSGDYPILALVNEGSQEKPIPYSKEGRYNVHGYFSEDCLDLMLEKPEYMTYKDGDILYVRLNNDNRYIFIYRYNRKCKTNIYVALDDNGKLWIEDNYITINDDIYELRFATEPEKQKLIEALKESKEPKAKEYLKRFFGIEQKQECEFKPFDKVLVRDGDRDKWKCDLFSHKTEFNSFQYMCVSDSYKYCIPYNEHTARLLGTTDNWEG